MNGIVVRQSYTLRVRTAPDRVRHRESAPMRDRCKRNLCRPTWGVLIILAGYVLFSHGCHLGDEDTELMLQTPAPVAGPAKDG
jgi:hypothetical protein